MFCCNVLFKIFIVCIKASFLRFVKYVAVEHLQQRLFICSKDGFLVQGLLSLVAKGFYLQQRWLFGSGNSIICTKGCLFVAKMAFWFGEFSHLQQRVFICSKEGFLVQGNSIICSKGCLFVAKMAFWFREFYHLQQRMFMYNKDDFLVQGILSFVAKDVYV